jgi:signal transduction histidine kinase
MLNATVSHELRSPISSIQSNIEAYEYQQTQIVKYQTKLHKIIDKLVVDVPTKAVAKEIKKVSRILKEIDKSIEQIDFVKMNMKTSCKMISYFVQDLLDMS